MLVACFSKHRKDSFESCNLIMDYLKKKAPFWKNEFYVDKSVLIPRSDSELLIESVIEYFPDLTKTYNFLDLGSGSGCLIISLLNEYLLSSGTGVEIDKKAIKVSEKNKEFFIMF